MDRKSKKYMEFLQDLELILIDRKEKMPEKSYTAKLFRKGVNKIAKKLGEEAVELVIEAKDSDEELFINEAADLLFHYMVLLVEKGFTLEDVSKVLKSRFKQ